MLCSKFLEWVNIQFDDSADSVVLKNGVLSMLYLCLREIPLSDSNYKKMEEVLNLKDEESVNIQSVQDAVFRGTSLFLYRVFDLVKSCSSDLQYIVIEEIKSRYPESPLAGCSLEPHIYNNNTGYDMIYRWLWEEFGLCL